MEDFVPRFTVTKDFILFLSPDLLVQWDYRFLAGGWDHPSRWYLAFVSYDDNCPKAAGSVGLLHGS